MADFDIYKYGYNDEDDSLPPLKVANGVYIVKYDQFYLEDRRPGKEPVLSEGSFWDVADKAKELFGWKG